VVTGPERQCIGCGRRGPQSGFLRLTLDQKEVPARVVVVGAKDRRGRGAYLCRRHACLDRAVQRKAFQRAFKKIVAVDADGISAVIMTEAQ
jgi:predicted RNA-binding protein YlxR (DUF448 family)